MSKTGQWYLDLCHDASELSKEDFLKKHGDNHEDIWEEVNNPTEQEPDFESLKNKLNEATHELDLAQNRLNDLSNRLNKVAENFLK